MIRARFGLLFVGVVLLMLPARRALATTEICGNNIDDNANGAVDEGCYPSETSSVCESPLSCGDTGMISWSTGSLHYDLPADIAPKVPFGPNIGFRRFYTSMYTPGANPTTVNHTPMGAHWQHTYMTWFQHIDTTHIVLHTSSGRDVLYTKGTGSGTFGDLYTPQPGDHVLSLQYNTTSLQARVQLLTGEMLLYNSSGQLIEIWDTLPTPNKVLVAWTGTSGGAVSTVTDANNGRRLAFSYTSGLLTSVALQTNTAFATWQTQYTRTFNYTSGVMTSVSDTAGTIQQYTYTGGYLTNISDGEGVSHRIAAFAYSSTVNGQVDQVETSRGSVGMEFSTTRATCTAGSTVLYFNKANATACNTDTDCGSGFMCGGKTGTGATGKCFQAARCMTLTTPSGYKEPVVTVISTVGPSGGACSGACADVAQYVWDTGTSLFEPLATKDPLNNYTSAIHNADGLVIRLTHGDNDSNAATGGARTAYYFYDTTYRGRLAEIRRKSDISTSSGSCSATVTTGCDRTLYTYGATDKQLLTIEHDGYVMTSGGTPSSLPVASIITYTHDAQGRITEIDGPVSGQKTTFDFYTSTDPNTDKFLQDYKTYYDSSHFLEPQVIAYDIWGNPTGVKAPDGKLTCQTFDSNRNYLSIRRRAMAGQTDCTTTNPADLTTVWSRDSANRLTHLQRPDGGSVLYSYKPNGQPDQVMRRDDGKTSSTGDTQQYTYSSDGQVLTLDTLNSSGTIVATQSYTYYNSRRLQEIINPASPTNFTGFLYDARGLLSEIDGEAGLSKEVEHYTTTAGSPGTEGRVTSVQRYDTSSLSDTWSILYAWGGEQSQVTDGDSKVTASIRDDFSRITKLTSPDFTGSTLRLYDVAGNRTTLIEDQGGAGQQTHTFTFDYLNRPLVDDYQGSCFVSIGTPHAEIQRSYDALPIGVPCPMGGGCNNLNGRLAYVETILTCANTYAATDGSLDQFTFYSYDDSGHIIEEYIKDDTGRVADTLYYYTNGRLTSIQTPFFDSVSWNYGTGVTGTNSDADRIVSIGFTGGTAISNVQWNSFGPWAQYDWQATIFGQGLRSRVARDAAYRITGVYEAEYQSGISVNDQLALTRDAMGRITSRVYTPHDPTIPGLYDSYFLYDEQSRVTCETTDLKATCPTTGTDIKNNHSILPSPFKSAGDWKQVLRPIPGSAGLTNNFNTSGTTYGTSHQITDVNQSDVGAPGHTAFAYDARGNRSSDNNTTMLTRDDRTYTYDGRRNLINVRGQYYTGSAWHYYDVVSGFDHKNRRVYKTFYDETSTKTAQWYFYYDIFDRLTEVKNIPDSSVPSTYSEFDLIWLDSRLVMYAQTDYPLGTTSNRYVASDETDRPNKLWNWPASGDASRYWVINQSAWGFDTNIPYVAGIYQPMLFAGQYQDVETIAHRDDGTTVHRPGLALNGFRTYDPFVGGYLQVDPLANQTWSSYIYVSSDPVGKSDVRGLCPEGEDCGGGSGSGGGTSGGGVCSFVCDAWCNDGPGWGCDCSPCMHNTGSGSGNGNTETTGNPMGPGCESDDSNAGHITVTCPGSDPDPYDKDWCTDASFKHTECVDKTNGATCHNSCECERDNDKLTCDCKFKNSPMLFNQHNVCLEKQKKSYENCTDDCSRRFPDRHYGGPLGVSEF